MKTILVYKKKFLEDSYQKNTADQLMMTSFPWNVLNIVLRLMARGGFILTSDRCDITSLAVSLALQTGNSL